MQSQSGKLIIIITNIITVQRQVQSLLVRMWTIIIIIITTVFITLSHLVLFRPTLPEITSAKFPKVSFRRTFRDLLLQNFLQGKCQSCHLMNGDKVLNYYFCYYYYLHLRKLSRQLKDKSFKFLLCTPGIDVDKVDNHNFLVCLIKTINTRCMAMCPITNPLLYCM